MTAASFTISIISTRLSLNYQCLEHYQKRGITLPFGKFFLYVGVLKRASGEATLPKKLFYGHFFLSVCVDHLIIKIPTYFIFEFPLLLIILIHMLLLCRLRQSANQPLVTAFDTSLNQRLVLVSFLCTSVNFRAGEFHPFLFCVCC